MSAQERIDKMKLALATAEADPENAVMTTAPARMCVTYHDGPGVQFMDANDRPLLPDLIREVETAVTLFNTLRRFLPPSASPQDGGSDTTIEMAPGNDGSLSFVFRRGAAYAYIDCGPRDTLHVYHDLPGKPKYEAVGLFTTPELLEQIDVIERAFEDAPSQPQQQDLGAETVLHAEPGQPSNPAVEIEWLRRLLRWCRPRLKDTCYQAWLDNYLASGPASIYPKDEPLVVNSRPESTSAPSSVSPDTEAISKRIMSEHRGDVTGRSNHNLVDDWQGLEAKYASALTAGTMREQERCGDIAHSWQRADAIRLAAGEMTAQELRTAQAVAGGIERAIRSRPLGTE